MPQKGLFALDVKIFSVCIEVWLYASSSSFSIFGLRSSYYKHPAVVINQRFCDLSLHLGASVGGKASVFCNFLEMMIHQTEQLKFRHKSLKFVRFCFAWPSAFRCFRRASIMIACPVKFDDLGSLLHRLEARRLVAKQGKRLF